MKTSKLIIAVATVITVATSTFAKFGAESRRHLYFGAGMVVSPNIA